MEIIDIWRAAQKMVEMYGREAGFIAGQRADALYEQGDVDGFHAWVHIVNSIRDLQANDPDEGMMHH